mgnify:FL=1
MKPLAVSEFSSAAQDLNLKIVNLAPKCDLINTQFKVKNRAKGNFSGAFDYQNFYEGKIPATLVNRD